MYGEVNNPTKLKCNLNLKCDKETTAIVTV